MSDSSLSNRDSTTQSEDDQHADHDVAVTQPLKTIADAESLVEAYSADEAPGAPDGPTTGEGVDAHQSGTPDETSSLESTGDATGEEFSIDEYMSSLLERYGGSSSGFSTRSNSEDQAPEREAVEAVRETTPPEQPKKWTPSKPPERKEELEALRHVANATARGAVNCHLGRQLVNHTFLKLTLATTATLASLACLMAARHAPSFRMTAVVAAIGGIFWAGQFFSLTAQLTGLAEMMSRETPSPSGASDPEEKSGTKDCDGAL